MGNRVGGIIGFSVNGVAQLAKGAFSYNLGRPLREAVIGADGVHGFKETPQVAYFEGEITDRAELDLNALLTLNNATATLQLANGKTIALRDAWFAGEGGGNTEEGAITVRLEGSSAEEV